jgi:hypothetical membrane protein
VQKTSLEVANASRATLLARLTLTGIGLYVVLDIIAQALPPHYSPISQAESDLAVGPYGYVMSINFIIRGLLSLAAVQAIRDGLPSASRSRIGEVLLGIWAIGAIILAFSPTDLPGQHPTLHGVIHLLVAVVAFIAGAVGALLISLRLRTDPHMRSVAPAAVAIAAAACFMLLVIGLQVGARHYGGLTERLFLGLVLLCLAVVAARLQSLTTPAR